MNTKKHFVIGFVLLFSAFATADADAACPSVATGSYCSVLTGGSSLTLTPKVYSASGSLLISGTWVNNDTGRGGSIIHLGWFPTYLDGVLVNGATNLASGSFLVALPWSGSCAGAVIGLLSFPNAISTTSLGSSPTFTTLSGANCDGGIAYLTLNF